MKRHALQLRAQAVRSIRDFFWERGFLEVETPLLVPANAPEEHIDPVPSSPFYLQTSPEICMKRLLCRGHDKLFQICRCWRSGERGPRHLSEFTMLEWYRSNCDYRHLMDDCRELLTYVARACRPERPLYRRAGRDYDPTEPWHCFTVDEAFMRFAGRKPEECLDAGCYEEVLCDVVEPALRDISAPVIVRDYPARLAALARLKPGEEDLAERFELYVAGLELANGFSELGNPLEQRARFEEANQARVASGRPPLPLPDRFLAELGALPPSAGIALGVDRLVMLLAGCDKIDDIVAFTPEEL